MKKKKVTGEFLRTRLSTIAEIALDNGDNPEKVMNDLIECVKKFDIDMDDTRKQIAVNAFCLAEGFRTAKASTKIKDSKFMKKCLPLSKNKKNALLKILNSEIQKGRVDKIMTPLLKRINKIDGICSEFCCSGHGEFPWVSIRINKKKRKYFFQKIIPELEEKYNAEIFNLVYNAGEPFISCSPMDKYSFRFSWGKDKRSKKLFYNFIKCLER